MKTSILIISAIILYVSTAIDIKKDNIVNTTTSVINCSVVSGSKATTTCSFPPEAVLIFAREGIEVEGYSYIYRDGKVMVSNK